MLVKSLFYKDLWKHYFSGQGAENPFKTNLSKIWKIWEI